MLAVQGPNALTTFQRVVGDEAHGLARHECRLIPWRGDRLLVARTGYTGEDDVECAAPAGLGAALWDALLEADAAPIGIGARDTLRLEASLPLHGSDISPSTHPFEAGLGWAIPSDDGADFTGRKSLLQLKETPVTRRLEQIQSSSRAVFRQGYPVHIPTCEDAGAPATLTSGAFGPTPEMGIGMSYLPARCARVGTGVEVSVRDRPVPAQVIRRPFFKRSSP